MLPRLQHANCAVVLGAVKVILKQLAETFAQIAEVSFSIGHVESSPQSMALAPPGSPCVRVVLDVVLEGRGGALAFVLTAALVVGVAGASAYSDSEEYFAEREYFHATDGEVHSIGDDAREFLRDLTD